MSVEETLAWAREKENEIVRAIEVLRDNLAANQGALMVIRELIGRLEDDKEKNSDDSTG